MSRKKWDKNEIESEKEIITLVEQLLELNMKIKNENLESNISPIKSRIEYCESRINEIVYILYGLTKDEINILNG